MRKWRESAAGRMAPLAIVLAMTVVLSTERGMALEHNLARPWGDSCSPPMTPFLAFSSPQSPDMVFAPEQAPGGSVEILCQAGLRSVGMQWTLHRNLVNKPFREGKAEPVMGNNFRIRLSLADLPPGFYDLRVTLDTGMAVKDKDPLKQRPVKGVCTFGWRVKDIAFADTRPADFDEFWKTAKASISNLPFDAKEGELKTFGPADVDAYNPASACLPPNFDPEGRRADRVESRKIDIAAHDGGRVYGWLAKPPGNGPFPAMLVLPGAGCNPRPRPLEHALHGYLAIDVQVHGQDVDLEKYENLAAGKDDPDPRKYYFYGVYLRALRMLDYLASRPDVDPKRIVVVGGSQGGRLSVVLSGLDPRIAAAVPAIAHHGNIPELHWVKRLNGAGAAKAAPTEQADGMDVKGAPPTRKDPMDLCLAYYDIMNFAVNARCPVMFGAGLVDPVSPPFGVYSAYLRWGGQDKTMVALAGLGHDWCAEFDRSAFRWLDKKLALPAAPGKK